MVKKYKIRRWLFTKWKGNGYFRRTLGEMFRENEMQLAQENAGIPDKAKIGRTIVGDEIDTFGKYRERFNKVNMRFGHRMLKPAIFTAEKILGKNMTTKIYDTPWNKNLIIFNDAFEKSLADWKWYYQVSGDRSNIKYGDPGNEPGSPYHMLRSMKRIMLTMSQCDTAYREFFNILMFNMTMEMNKQHNSQVKHLMYNSKEINDVKYFHISGTLEGNYVVPWGDKFLVVSGGSIVLDEVPKGWQEEDIKIPKGEGE
jgi:hypothetical protein